MTILIVIAIVLTAVFTFALVCIAGLYLIGIAWILGRKAWTRLFR